MPSEDQTKEKKPTVYHCLDVWAIPEDLYRIRNVQERAKAIRTLVRSSTSKPIGLERQIAPISFVDHAMVLAGLFLCMGGPLLWMFFGTYWIFLGGTVSLPWRYVEVVAVSATLAIHPLPSRHSNFIQNYYLTSRFTIALYKYFTYRVVWVDDALEELLEFSNKTSWIGAGPPHGVLPFANILSIPVITSVLGLGFVGSPAPIVFYTPFLRYLTLFPSVSVDKKTLAAALVKEKVNVGLVPDGIAGIFHQSREKEVVALANRMGMAKLALKHQIGILPAYSFNNTAVFTSWWDPWRIMERISRKLKAAIFLYWGRFGLPIPHRVPITMVCGNVIVPPKTKGPEPTLEEVRALHDEVLSSIRDCFECHKESVGWKNKELVFV